MTTRNRGSAASSVGSSDSQGNSVNRTTQTDGNGAYSFAGLAAGTYTITENAANYTYADEFSSSTGPFALGGGQNASFNFAELLAGS